MENNLIALDADGVLLNYHLAYKHAWERAFSEKLTEVDPKAYWALNRWGARKLHSHVELSRLHDEMREDFWSNMEPMAGAVQACHLLVEQGYRLVCVTALAAKYGTHRMNNLQSLGMPIEQVYATGSDWKGKQDISPKAAILNELRPVAFVDDFAPYFRGLNTNIHAALISNGEEDSPNVGDDLNFIHSSHSSLLSFAKNFVNVNFPRD